jgi:hypothetical protein
MQPQPQNSETKKAKVVRKVPKDIPKNEWTAELVKMNEASQDFKAPAPVLSIDTAAPITPAPAPTKSPPPSPVKKVRLLKKKPAATAAAEAPKKATLLEPPTPIPIEPTVAPVPATTLLEPQPAEPPTPQDILPSPEKFEQIVMNFVIKNFKYVGLREERLPFFMKITSEFDPERKGWSIEVFEPITVQDGSAQHYYPQWITSTQAFMDKSDIFNIMLYDESRDYFHIE